MEICSSSCELHHKYNKQTATISFQVAFALTFQHHGHSVFIMLLYTMVYNVKKQAKSFYVSDQLHRLQKCTTKLS